MVGPKTTAQLKRITLTDDLMGGFIEGFSTIGEVNGTLVDVSGDERFDAMKQTVVATHKFFIDYPVNNLQITEKDRLIINSKEYYIKFVKNPFYANRFLTLTLLLFT
jgi:SPP1 family predicted phage head-tail adaptor